MKITKLLETLSKEDYKKKMSEADQASVHESLVECYGNKQNVVISTERGLITQPVSFTSQSYSSVYFFLKENKSSLDYLINNILFICEAKIFEKYNSELMSLLEHIRWENMKLKQTEQLKEDVKLQYTDINDKIRILTKDIDKIRDKSEQMIKKVQKSNRDLKNFENNLTDGMDRLKSVQTSFISIIGMFSAIIFALFGGMQMLSTIVGGIQSAQTVPQVLILIAIFNMLFIALYLFVYLILSFIAKIVKIEEKVSPVYTIPFTTKEHSLSKALVFGSLLFFIISFWMSIGLNQNSYEEIVLRKQHEIKLFCLDRQEKILNKAKVEENKDADEMCAQFEAIKSELSKQETNNS